MDWISIQEHEPHHEMEVWYKNFSTDAPKLAVYKKPHGYGYGFFVDKETGQTVAPLPCCWATLDVVY